MVAFAGTQLSGLVGTVESVLANMLRLQRKRPADAPPSGAASAGFLLGHSLPFGNDGPAPGTAIYLSDDLLSKHVGIYGSSGSGKSVCLRRLRMHSYWAGHAVFDLDFLGDSADLEIRQLAAMGKRAPTVAMIDARQASWVARLNLLGGPGSPHSRTEAFVRALGAEAEGLGVRVKFNALAASLALAELGFGITELQSLLSVDRGFRSYVMERIADEHSRTALAEFDRLSAETQRTYWLEIANKVSNFVFAPDTRLMYGQEGFPDFGELLDKPSRVTLVALGASRQPGASLLAKVLIASLERHVMARSEIPAERRQPTRLVIDEASRVAGFGLESLLAEGRRMACSVFTAMQFTQQAEPQLREALRSNCSTQIFFAAGGSQATELASEIVCGLPRERVRETLISLKVGCAMVVRRGERPVVVRMPDSPVPTVPDGDILALRETALPLTSVTREEALAAMAKRSAWMASLTSAQSGGSVVNLRRPTVRGRSNA